MVNQTSTNKILFTGCYRGATLYIYRIMSLCGLVIGHEHVLRDGTVDWFAMYQDRRKEFGGPEKFDKVVHQMRHPLDNIDSMRHLSSDTWNYIKSWIPHSEKANEDRIQRGMEAWYQWSLRGREISHYRYRVESISSVFDGLCKFVGVEPNRRALGGVPRNEHYNPDKLLPNYVYLTWKDLEETDSELCDNIRKLAMEYGYPEWNLE